uniref:Palmitoyltransferase n=1 Tax=Strongyloides papillosus TaxID=174720 RepID=A0A0N5BHU2_STREA
MKCHKKIWHFCETRIFTFEGKCQRWIPVIFVLITTIMAYLIFGFQQFEVVTKSYTRKQFDLIIVSFFIIMYLWSFLRVVASKNKQIPNEYKFPPQIRDAYDNATSPVKFEEVAKTHVLRNDLPVQNRLRNGSFRYCHKCMIVKPDRTHHCSSCDQCIVKFDHHCPWVNNCVMFTNYKYFLLFLIYGTLLHTILSVNNIESVIDYAGNKDTKEYRHVDSIIILCFTVNFILNFGSLAATLTMLLWHLTLVGRNLTTNESYRSPIFLFGADKKAYNISILHNYREVFGSKKLLWFIPVWTSKGDGFIFKQRKYDRREKNNDEKQRSSSVGVSSLNSSFNTATSTNECSRKPSEKNSKQSEKIKKAGDDHESQNTSSYTGSISGNSSTNESDNVLSEEKNKIKIIIS